jgi:hypothetical protein
MSFQFNGFGSQSSPAAPRFAVPTVVPPSAGEQDEESDEEEGEGDDLQLNVEEKTEVEGDREDDAEQDSQVQDHSVKVEAPHAGQQTAESPEKTEGLPELWQVHPSVNGVEMMGSAVVDTLQPSLDATIRRIAELKESQQVRRTLRSGRVLLSCGS